MGMDLRHCRCSGGQSLHSSHHAGLATLRSIPSNTERHTNTCCWDRQLNPQPSSRNPPSSEQARNNYRPADIRMNEHFTAIGLHANWRGNVGLDFTHFDTTVAAAGLPAGLRCVLCWLRGSFT